MPMTLAKLLQDPSLGLRELHRGPGTEESISWASSSDLLDPTPFLVADQLLLTTGRQFPEDATANDYAEYAENLMGRGVLGVGYGTEVLRLGTPAGLVAACAAVGLALVEVPYRTPFLAIIRRVAREAERDARQRDDWALAASRSISAAALPRGDVASVLRELAVRLGSRVLMFDADAELERVFPRPRRADPTPAVVDQVRRMLGAGVRAGGEIAAGDDAVVLQTIGPSGELAGVLAVQGARLDRAARTVLAAAIALVEVGVAETRRGARSSLARSAVVLRLLRESRRDLADAIAEASGASLPTPAVVIVTTAPHRESLESLAEREARTGDRLVVIEGRFLTCVVEPAAAAATAARLAGWGYSVGLAAIEELVDIDTGIARAAAVQRHAPAGTAADWAQLPSPNGLLGSGEFAAALLSPISATATGAAAIETSDVWFEENCNWGATGRRLGLHPHTVRSRVAFLASQLDIDLSGFEGRARLWSTLRAARLNALRGYR